MARIAGLHDRPTLIDLPCRRAAIPVGLLLAFGVQHRRRPSGACGVVEVDRRGGTGRSSAASARWPRSWSQLRCTERPRPSRRPLTGPAPGPHWDPSGPAGSDRQRRCAASSLAISFGCGMTGQRAPRYRELILARRRSLRRHPADASGRPSALTPGVNSDPLYSSPITLAAASTVPVENA